jgi:hypothetical protein
VFLIFSLLGALREDSFPVKCTSMLSPSVGSKVARGMTRKGFVLQSIWAGAEDGTVLLWDTRSPTPALTLSGAHAARIRGVAPLGNAGVSGFETLVASAASDGTVCVWDGRMTGAHDDVTPLAETATSARLTCLGVVAPRRSGEAAVKLQRSGEAPGKLQRSEEAAEGRLQRKNKRQREPVVNAKHKV